MIVDIRQRGVGDGPMRGIWSALPALMTDERDFFKEVRGAYSLDPFPEYAEDPGRIRRLKAFGSANTLHILARHRAMPKTSMALVLAAVLNPAQMIQLPVAYIKEFDPHAAEQLATWATIDKDTFVPRCPRPGEDTEQQRNVLNLIYDIGLDVSSLITHPETCFN